MSEDKFDSGEWEMQGDEHLLTCRFCDKEDSWVHLKVWKNLTGEELLESLKEIEPETQRLPPGFIAYARIVEAKLKQKNFTAQKGEAK